MKGEKYMASSEIKIFYSWQSDLPGSRTRYLIQDSIEAAVSVMKDTVELVADRDTKGEFGAPDIAQTIFSKIDECDIFIADVSIINKYHSVDEGGNLSEGIKTTPNPNVLLELGYAAHVLGWENVICIINTDFGDIDDLPFDIAHRRLTPYSLKEKGKAEVKKEIRDIIAATVMNLLENGKRTKGTYANHIVGGYEFENYNISKELIGIDIANTPWYKEFYESNLLECKMLIEEIDSIKLQPSKEMFLESSSTINECDEVDEKIITSDGILLSKSTNKLFEKFNASSHIVYIKDDDKKLVIQRTKELLGISLLEDFFYMGNLHIKNTLIPGRSSEYIGTEDEKKKYHMYIKLDYKLAFIQMLTMYLKTFTGMYLFPMAIYNVSSRFDKDISIHIKVDEETVDVVLPTKDLFYEELKGLEGWVYGEGIVKNLLIMPETSDIKYDGDISYNTSDIIRQMKNTPMLGLGNSSPEYDSEDYEHEIKKYIASPIDGSKSDFEYYIKDLRPKEKKWLGAAILIRPKKDKVKLSFEIKSQYSDGELRGAFEWEIPNK